MMPFHWLVATLCAQPSGAVESTLPTTPPPSVSSPTLIVLPACLTNESVALAVQLRLVIEDYAVDEADEVPLSLCLPNGVQEAETIRDQRRATAAVWLSARDDGRAHLSLLVVLGGHAMLSEYDGAPDAGGLMTMALLVREWLPPAQALTDDLDRLARRWREKSTPPHASSPVEAPSPDPAYVLSAWTGVSDALMRHVGSAVTGEIGLKLERTISQAPSFSAGLRASARLGRYGQPSGREVSGSGGRVGAVSCYEPMPKARLQWRPCLAVELEAQWLRVRDGNATGQSVSYVTPRLALPQELRVGLGGPLGLTLGGEAGLRWRQQEMRSRSDDHRVLLTPRYDWQISAGAFFSFDLE